jgi:hypothetical protein
MKGRLHHLISGRILASSFALVGALTVAPAYAGGPSASDYCSSPLPTQLAFSGGGPNTSVYTLHGRAGTLTIVQFGGNGLASELRLLGYRRLPGEIVGEFTIVTPGKAHIYGGPVHVFRHPLQQHVCRTGAIEVDAAGNTTQQTNPYRLDVRIDGTIRGRQARVSVWIGSTRYTFSGVRTV